MKKPYLALIAFACFVAVVMLIAPGWAATPPADQAGSQEYSQPEPYTATNFGPWSEAVAKTHVPQVKFEKSGAGLKVTIQIDNHPATAVDLAAGMEATTIRIDDGAVSRIWASRGKSGGGDGGDNNGKGKKK